LDLELRPKAFLILRHLVEHAGKLLSKDDLVNVAWPDVSVSDDSLAQCMRDIRKLLDDQDQKFIKTVPRRGYMFVTDVTRLGDTSDVKQTKQFLNSPLSRIAYATLAFLCLSIVLLVVWAAAFWTKGRPSYWPQQGSAEAGTGMLLPRTILLSGKTVLGQSIVYPMGEPEITASTFVLWPGQMTRWHVHPAPLVIYVIEGTLTIDYGSKGIRRYESGEALVEAIDWPHKANNFTHQPVRLLILSVGTKGMENLIWADQK
jgi:DNA-binding winged helix-turn-helix (wHTH) protein/quercetin dioxygenase-like cupin family protein